MSHRDYCARMDDGQLRALIGEAESRIKLIKEAGYVRVWALSRDSITIKCFAQQDYGGALAELANQARLIASDPQAKARDMTLEILSVAIPAGEVNEYLSYA